MRIGGLEDSNPQIFKPSYPQLSAFRFHVSGLGLPLPPLIKPSRFPLGFGVLLLVAGLALVVVGSRPPPPRTFHGSVKDLLPDPEFIKQAGWTVEYLPIANTPEVKAKVDEVLNYDDAVFATYTRGTARLSVYVAYWRPGKMRYRDVAGHTPDRCWVGAGWKTVAARSGVCLPDGNGGQLQPAEERTMILNGNTEHVAFWHMLDGRPMSYGITARPPPTALFTDLFKYKLNLRPEQFFVRISSNEPGEKWKSAEVFRLVASRLPVSGQPGGNIK